MRLILDSRRVSVGTVGAVWDRWDPAFKVLRAKYISNPDFGAVLEKWGSDVTMCDSLAVSTELDAIFFVRDPRYFEPNIADTGQFGDSCQGKPLCTCKLRGTE